MKLRSSSALIVLLLTLIYLTYSLSVQIWDRHYLSLRESIQALDQTEADLSTVTAFEWDRVYFFEPYTPVETIYETVGYEWRSISATVSEGMNQVVFMDENEVTCYVYGYPENNGFGLSSDQEVLTKADDLTFQLKYWQGIPLLERKTDDIP
ncbi:hypothetical protein ACFO4L_01145 [Bacillus daqingensis]|uniref:DUF4830 domain-containing protein n=1 Tax=Bacillus daqingensis TaxID=872396 RepID=A0ABV9NPC2_9BACI